MYSLEKFLAAYDSGHLGSRTAGRATGGSAQVSAAAQSARIRMRIPTNTTIVGLGADARIIGAWFDIRPGRATTTRQPT